MIIANVSAANEVITVQKIRWSKNDNQFRMVLDTDKPIEFQETKKTDITVLEIKLSNVVFDSAISNKQPPEAIFSRAKFVSAIENKPTVITFELKKKMNVRIAQHPPKGRYGNRLVFDFTEAVPRKKITKTGETVVNLTKTIENSSSSDNLFITAQQAMAKQDFANALSVYQRLMANADPTAVQRATEYYAVALELSGKKARAKLEYKNYLKRYPNGDGATRIQQRLSTMLSMTKETTSLKSGSREPATKKPKLESWGTFFENFRTYKNRNNEGKSETTLSSAYSTINANSRIQTENWEVSARVNGSYETSFLDERDGRNSLSYFYISGESKKNGSSAKLGRQRQRSGGIIGRFDGISLKGPLTDSIKLNVVAGYPVDRSTNTSIEKEKSFYGINADLGPYYEDMRINVFYVSQKLDGFIDREATGGEINYFGSNYYLSALIDYDIHFDELNALLLNGRYQFEGGSSASLSLSIRKSPYLTTQNALIGQQLETLTELQERIDGLDSLEDIALDRTFDSTSLNFYLDYPFRKNISFNTSITVSELSDTPSSAGVLGYQGTDVEYYTNSQIVFNNLIVKRDIFRSGFSYASLSNSTIYSVYSYYQFQINNQWRLYPRISAQLRDNNNNDQSRYSMTLRSEYSFMGKHRVDGQLGVTWFNTDNQIGNSTKFTSYFFNLGYSYSF